MTFLWQILEKRRWLIGITGVLFLPAVFYFVFNLAQTESFAPLKAGFESLRNADFDGFSPTAVFFLLIAATLISEDLACIAAGVLASQNKIGLFPAIAACAVGIFIGDTLTFLAGRVLGRRALKWKITGYFLSEEAVEKSSRWLEQQGMKTVFISRFVFGMRLPLYFGAGVLKTSFWRFALYFSLAVAVWTPIVVVLTYKAGAEAVKMSLFNQNLWLGLLALIAACYVLFRLAQRLLVWKGWLVLWEKIRRRQTDAS
jgi:membrane protein DedA with SNARE-associated domain